MDCDDEDVPTLVEIQQRRVPLTIISGFLGAGKSTLLRRILSERHGYRIAVIMNEFGDTADIEAKTINVSSATSDSEEFLELANGCLCCSIKDSGIAAIEKLMQRKGAFDYILLETTGLADPGPIAQMFWQNEEFALGLGKDICLDGVVCVVDAVFGKKQMLEDGSLEDTGESLRQVAAADVILLNKTDLVPSQSELISVEDIIKKINPAATVHRTIKARIDLSHVIGIDAYSTSLARTARLGPQTRREQDEHPNEQNHEHGHDHEGKTHYEIRGISSLQIVLPRLSLSHIQKLDEWVRTVLWENRLPAPSSPFVTIEVLRCKGHLLTDTNEEYLLQGVRNLYEMSKVQHEDAKGERETMGLPDRGKLVLIGKGLGEDVRRSLLQLVGCS